MSRVTDKNGVQIVPGDIILVRAKIEECDGIDNRVTARLYGLGTVKSPDTGTLIVVKPGDCERVP